MKSAGEWRWRRCRVRRHSVGCAAALPMSRRGSSCCWPDSLAGWDYGPQPPAHWIISDGRLTGNAESTPLLSGWTVGDFELRFDWSASPGGAWTLGLPDVPTGPGLQLTLQRRDGCGAMRDGEPDAGRRRASVEAVGAAELHSADIRRFGRHAVGDRRRPRGERSRRSIATAASAWRWPCPRAKPRSTTCGCEEPRGNPLFNGRDLTGWFVNNNKGTWTVDNGDIIPTFHTGLHYLRTDKRVRQLHLVVRVHDLQGGQLGRRHSHGQGRLALGRRHGAADSRPARDWSRTHDGHLRQPAAARPGRQVGRVEPRGRSRPTAA